MNETFLLEMRWVAANGNMRSASVQLPQMLILDERKEFSEAEVFQAMDFLRQLQHIYNTKIKETQGEKTK